MEMQEKESSPLVELPGHLSSCSSPLSHLDTLSCYLDFIP